MAYKTLLIYIDPLKNTEDYHVPWDKECNYVAIAIDDFPDERFKEFYPKEYALFIKWKKSKRSPE